MSAPEIISKLIERFEHNSQSYKSGIYNEAQVRQEFINPFFDALAGMFTTKKDMPKRTKM